RHPSSDPPHVPLGDAGAPERGVREQERAGHEQQPHAQTEHAARHGQALRSSSEGLPRFRASATASTATAVIPARDVRMPSPPHRGAGTLSIARYTSAPAPSAVKRANWARRPASRTKALPSVSSPSRAAPRRSYPVYTGEVGCGRAHLFPAAV